jgi:hypothetical protein
LYGYSIRRYRATLTVAANDDDVYDTAPYDVNGLLRTIVITPPASITGSSYGIYILGNQGETLFSKTSLSANSIAVINKDISDAQYLSIPLAIQAGDKHIRIVDAGESGATGTLTSNQTNALNNETITVGSVTYTFKNTLTGAANEIAIAANVAATATLTSDNTNVSDGETVTIGASVYTFRTALTPTVGEVLIGADADTSLTNLKKAINGEAGAGTNYATGTPVNASMTSSTVSAHALTLTAIVAGPSGSAITTTETSAHLSFGGATASGGSYNGDSTLTNVKKAVNAEAGAGTNYGTGTVANADATAGSVTSHAIIFTSTALPGTGVVTTSTSAAFTWGAAHLTGGGEASTRTFTVDLLIDRR